MILIKESAPPNNINKLYIGLTRSNEWEFIWSAESQYSFIILSPMSHCVIDALESSQVPCSDRSVMTSRKKHLLSWFSINGYTCDSVCVSYNSLDLLVALKIKESYLVILCACYYKFLSLAYNNLIDLLQTLLLAIIVAEVDRGFFLACGSIVKLDERILVADDKCSWISIDPRATCGDS